MEKHYVHFLSPGTLVAEEDTKEIDAWSVDLAIILSKEITQRYGAKPYCFYFTTKRRDETDFDSKVVHKSCKYYLSGEVKTIEQVRNENNPENETLIRNMERNGWDKVVQTKTPYLWTQPLREDDIILNVKQ
jgi:hypothetical protein